MTRLNLHTSFPLGSGGARWRHRSQIPQGVEVDGSRTLPWESVAHDVSTTIGAGELQTRMSLIRVHLQCFGVTGMLQSLVTYRLLKSCSAKPSAPLASVAVSPRPSWPAWLA